MLGEDLLCVHGHIRDAIRELEKAKDILAKRDLASRVSRMKVSPYLDPGPGELLSAVDDHIKEIDATSVHIFLEWLEIDYQNFEDTDRYIYRLVEDV